MMCAIGWREVRLMEKRRVYFDQIGYPQLWWVNPDGTESYWPIPRDGIEVIAPNPYSRAFRYV